MSEDEKKTIPEIEKTDIISDEVYIGNFEDRFVSRALFKTGHGVDDDIHDLPRDTEFILSKVSSLSDEEAIAILEEAIVDHDDDPNFPEDDYLEMKELVSSKNVDDPEWQFEAKLLAVLIAFHSPYPEVRSVTDPFDDKTLPVETIRSYFLGIIWTIIGSGVNEFFSHRQPSISLSTSIIQILLYPCGMFCEKFLPDWGFTVRGKRHSLNPGPWNYKEQMFATILFAVTSPGVYASYNIITQKVFYHSTWVSFGFQFLLDVSTQFIGFSFAGILRKFVIYPVRAMWPTALPTLALNRALLKPEKKENIHGWTISKYKFFWITFFAMFCYFWIPDYLFQALSTFNWMNWIAPNNFNLAIISGSTLGLGLNPIPTFDWNIASYLTPLTIPFFSQVNMVAGVMMAFFCIVGVYYSNYYWSAYLPINSNSIFTNTGASYQVSEVLTDGLLDLEKYRAYSPPLYSAANLVTYGAFFAIYPLVFIYTCYIERKSIVHSLKQVKKSLQNFRRSNFADFKDPHSRMMAEYEEVPDYYFLIILIISLVLGIICVEIYPTNTPVWGIFFTIGINFVFLVPLVLVFAVTGQQLGLNVLVELIVGYALPGNGTALMTLKAFGYNIDGQADNYISDQKMLHYAKISPMAIFRGQIITTMIQVFVSLGVVNWQISNVENFCDPEQSQRFSCPNERTYYSASVFWGVIGPKRVFGEIYPLLKWCFLMGFLISLLLIAIKWRFPRLFRNTIQPTVIVTGFLNIFAPYNLNYVLPGMYISYAFMYHIRRRYLSWFEKYNYVLTSALDAGVAFSAVIIFFAVQYHPKNISWWGNNVPWEGIDGENGRIALIEELPARGFFGPDSWS